MEVFEGIVSLIGFASIIAIISFLCVFAYEQIRFREFGIEAGKWSGRKDPLFRKGLVNIVVYTVLAVIVVVLVYFLPVSLVHMRFFSSVAIMLFIYAAQIFIIPIINKSKLYRVHEIKKAKKGGKFFTFSKGSFIMMPILLPFPLALGILTFTTLPPSEEQYLVLDCVATIVLVIAICLWGIHVFKFLCGYFYHYYYFEKQGRGYIVVMEHEDGNRWYCMKVHKNKDKYFDVVRGDFVLQDLPETFSVMDTSKKRVAIYPTEHIS